MAEEVSVPVKKRHKRLFWLVVASALAVVVAGGLFLYFQLTQPPIPRDIVNQLDFSPFIMTDSENGKMAVSSYKYDKPDELFSFIMTRKPNESFIFSEQPTPSEFNDVPDFYQDLLNKVNSYATVQTFNGPLNLALPPNSPTTGILATQQGVLMFIKSTGAEPSQDDWRSVVESLNIYKLNQ